MRALVSLLSVFLLGGGMGVTIQQPKSGDSCGFTVSGSTTKPTITGPEDIASRVYVVEQPDSPVEIEAINFEGSWLAVQHERFTEELRCTLKVHNRSDQWVRSLDAWVDIAAPYLGTGVGYSGRPLTIAPGGEAEVRECGGHGTGSAPKNYVRIVVFVELVYMDGCVYKPSMRFPPKLELVPPY